MNELMMEKGMHVIISENPRETGRTHTLTSKMRGMAGNQFVIDSIVNTVHGKSAVIKSLYWHYNDLTELSVPAKKEHIFHFDIKNLVT